MLLQAAKGAGRVAHAKALRARKKLKEKADETLMTINLPAVPGFDQVR